MHDMIFVIPELSMASSAPDEHKFKLAIFQPTEPKNFLKFVRKEIKLLESNLPDGIHVKCFEDRMVNCWQILVNTILLLLNRIMACKGKEILYVHI